jgi:hypothetical protein
MTHISLKEIIADLGALLERERASLINGDLDIIATMLPEKEKLIAQINGSEVEQPGDFSDLHAKITRNQALLDSAMEGIRTVSRRMSTLQRLQKSLDTYDSHGRKSDIIATGISSVEKRA